MEPFEFINIIKPLVHLYGEITEDKRKIYYDNLKYYPTKALEEAIHQVIRTHETRMFPPIPAILDALHDIIAKYGRPASNPGEIQVCMRCGGSGWIEGLSDYIGKREYTCAVPCDRCDLGAKRRRILQKCGIRIHDKPLLVEAEIIKDAEIIEDYEVPAQSSSEDQGRFKRLMENFDNGE